MEPKWFANFLPSETSPQLGASEPLVRRWRELPKSRSLREWSWFGDGIVGAIERRKTTQIVHWKQLSDNWELITKLEFRVSSLALSPCGDRIGIVPQETVIFGASARANIRFV